MRVLHVSTGTSWRGGERQALMLLEGLRRRDVPTLLVAPRASPLAERAVAAGFPVRAIPIVNEGDAVALGRIAGLARRERVDVLHAHTSQAHGLAAAAARLLGRRRPAVVVTRRVEHSIFRHSFLRLDRIKYDPGADLVLCVSERVRDVLRADGIADRQLALVPDGVDVASFAEPGVSRKEARAAWDLPTDAYAIGCVGRLEAAKGQDLLVDVLPALRAGGLDARLLLVGTGPAVAALRTQSAERGVSEALVLTGERSDVPRVLAALDVFAFPSRSEGLGSAVLEALAAGVPVVASRVGGLPEALAHGEAGLLVPADDREAWTAALRAVHAAPEAALVRATMGRAHVASRFSQADLVEATLAAYRRALTLRR